MCICLSKNEWYLYQIPIDMNCLIFEFIYWYYMCAFDLILPLINKAIALLIYIDFSVETNFPLSTFLYQNYINIFPFLAPYGTDISCRYIWLNLVYQTKKWLLYVWDMFFYRAHTIYQTQMYLIYNTISNLLVEYKYQKLTNKSKIKELSWY